MTLYIFDKDGTLVSGLNNRPANTPDEQKPLPNVVEMIAELRAAGHTLSIASNQGGVAWGFITYQEAQELVKDAARKVGSVDHWRCCPYDERAKEKNPTSIFASKSYRRKPAPGMIYEIMRSTHSKPDDTIMIGDQESDRQAADRAGITFIHAADFFKWRQ